MVHQYQPGRGLGWLALNRERSIQELSLVDPDIVGVSELPVPPFCVHRPAAHIGIADASVRVPNVVRLVGAVAPVMIRALCVILIFQRGELAMRGFWRVSAH